MRATPFLKSRLHLLSHSSEMAGRSRNRSVGKFREDRIAEQLRRVAFRTTREIVLRKGNDLGMVLGCGYPKSGTTWLCQVMGSYLGIPHPRDYLTPIAMASVIHAHWRYNKRFPPAAYIRRDGRDVMVSLYFFHMRALDGSRKPARARQLREEFGRLFGSAFDPTAVRDNLPTFIEWQLTSPRGSYGLAWHQHVADWWDRPRVGHVSYENLLADPVAELASAMTTVTGRFDPVIADLSVQRWAFAVAAGRTAGVEDRQSSLRKGISGDWRSHFGRDAGEVFDAAAGDALVELGYADDRSWWRGL